MDCEGPKSVRKNKLPFTPQEVKGEDGVQPEQEPAAASTVLREEGSP